MLYFLDVGGPHDLQVTLQPYSTWPSTGQNFRTAGRSVNQALQSTTSGNHAEIPLLFKESTAQRVGCRICCGLESLSKHCNFGDTLLDKMIRDRLARGINDSSTQKKLLTERDLTLQWALAIAEGSEAADRDLKEMKALRVDQFRVKEEPVHKVKGKGNATPQVTCHQCGIPGDVATTCRHRDQVSYMQKERTFSPSMSFKPESSPVQEVQGEEFLPTSQSGTGGLQLRRWVHRRHPRSETKEKQDSTYQGTGNCWFQVYWNGSRQVIKNIWNVTRC